MLNIIFVQIPEQPRKWDFAYPYDSSHGISAPYFWIAVIILSYLAIRFYFSLKRDKKAQLEKEQGIKKEKTKKKKKWKPPTKNVSASSKDNSK